MRVLIIPPGVLPVPATKGGAVEKLIETYINENEKQHRINFTIYTIQNNSNNNLEYKYTEFKYIKNNKLTYKIERAFRWIINNKLPKIHIGNVYISKVAKALKNDNTNYDVIILENNPFAILKLRKIFPKTKIILHLHNDYLNIETKKAKRILNLYDEIIAISKYIKSRVDDIEKTEKVKVVYNGVNTDIFSRNIEPQILEKAKEKYGIKKDDIVLLYTGRLVEEKGVKELIEAANRIIDTNPNIKLLIVGSKASSDSKKDLFINKINNISKKHEKNIIFVGFVQYEKLPIFHQISNIQVIPSKWEEPLGNVVIEGMASGIKQIVTNSGGIPEIVQGTSASIIETKDLEENLYKSICENINKEKYQRKRNEKEIKVFSESVYSNNIFKELEKWGTKDE